jgi:hypothetical protein
MNELLSLPPNAGQVTGRSAAERRRRSFDKMLRVERVRVGVVQAASVVFDVDATLKKVATLAAEASAAGAQLAVFPEAFVPGYPRGVTFGTVVGSRSAEGRDHFCRYWDASVDIPGPAIDRLAEIAATHAMHLVIGVIERDGGTLYCTAAFFAPEGYLGKHRKLMPTAAERIVWGFGDGSTLPVFDTSIGRIGATICWETCQNELLALLVRHGAQLGHRRPEVHQNQRSDTLRIGRGQHHSRSSRTHLEHGHPISANRVEHCQRVVGGHLQN